MLERLGEIRAAARAFAAALRRAPPPDQAPEPLRAPLARARAAVDADRTGAHAALTTAAPAPPGSRLAHAAAVFAGVSRAYRPEPLQFDYPGLPIEPFFDRAHFPWLAELEAATPVIAAEHAAARTALAARFAPYVAMPPGVPRNQWAALDANPAWSTLYLWRDGTRRDDVCAACPQTTALLARLPLLDQPGFGPTAMFSALGARTAIPPHTGSSNTRAIVHLPLELPGPARFRVGSETRDWRVGEAWVFDDTIEHEAWNDAPATRTILIFDVWNPHLSADEREGVTALMAARRAWYGGGGFEG